jgi:hypothetical protein
VITEIGLWLGRLVGRHIVAGTLGLMAIMVLGLRVCSVLTSRFDRYDRLQHGASWLLICRDLRHGP